MKALRAPDEAIQIEDRWYVLATSSRRGEPHRVLKHGETFALFDRNGDMPRAGGGEHGLYHQGTRYLSTYELRVNGQRPMLLNSSVRRDNSALVVDLTNPDMQERGEPALPKGTLHISRTWVVRGGTAHERLEIGNFGLEEVGLRVALEYRADFADIFEVRGFERERRGSELDPRAFADRAVLAYRGLDGVTRQAVVAWSCEPARCTPDRAEFEVVLAPGAEAVIETTVSCAQALAGEPLAASPAPVPFARVAREAVESLKRERRGATLTAPDPQFNAWIERSAADLAMLTDGNPEGPYPYAGVPWYSVPFGRDGILTAIEYLWADPEMARGVLLFLAGTQARESSARQDAEPGKIVHEMRKGELAALGEIPFGRYYGTIDATPLFVVLAGEYFQRTADIDTLRSVWPHVVRALDWIEQQGDVDGDGYVEYARRNERGLLNQGWKDSEDSIFHADGTLATGPIALAEVQSYVYLARVHAARLARTFGEPERADRLERQAEALRLAFERDFWCPELGTYALALDGAKRPCRVRTSNAGHALWCGIASPERAAIVGATLMAPDSFSGWGVRTVARGQSRYNPMSYHNGSIWPHDNALVAMGLARYGMKHEAAAIATAMHDASLFMDLHRLPELFCGFDRRASGEGPTLYPVACSPQAWASAAPFYLVKACLGLSFRPGEPRIRFLHPVLPRFLERLRIDGLQAGGAVVDVLFERHAGGVGVQVSRREGEVEVSVVL